MATTKKAPAKKTAAKRAPARKSTAKRAAPRKAIAAKKPAPKLKQSAEKALNIYLGVIGKGIDTLQENIDSVRKDSDKYLQSYEKRGVQLRKKLSKRFDKLDVPGEIEEAVEEAKEQLGKLQDQIEDVVETAKDKYKAAKAA
jgi:CII-binding regulator of phage lambda lysogenization HflD